MGTWTLWIAFNAGVAILLLLDLGLFHRRAHVISLREAAIESGGWIALSVCFGLWIWFSHGRGPGLEFFSGYVIEKSLSIDNVFVFLLIFQYFRVDPRYQHRLLFWGVLGALVMRGAMIGVGTVLISRFEWILYLFGVFLLYAGFKLFNADHSVHPDKNPFLHWLEKILPMSHADSGPHLFVRESGRWLVTPLFLVVVVLETTDLVFAADSIPAVFGVTRDPFLVYSSNVCAILGLRAFYFLLAGILPYFKFLDDGLAIILMFIGGKMLAEPWLHISTELSLAVVGGVLAGAVIVSVFAAKPGRAPEKRAESSDERSRSSGQESDLIHQLADIEINRRIQVAYSLFSDGTRRISEWLDNLLKDQEFKKLVVYDQPLPSQAGSAAAPKLTVGIAVQPETFNRIHAANGSPSMANAPADQDVVEFELEFKGDSPRHFRLDILTTNTPAGNGPIARFLEKFGEGIQQVELDVTDADRATEILRTRFQANPIYPASRLGANGTRVNFFLISPPAGKKMLVELVEQPVQIS